MPNLNLSDHLDRLSQPQYFLMSMLKTGRPIVECLEVSRVKPAEYYRWIAEDLDFRAVFFHWRSIMAELATVQSKGYQDVCPFEPILPDTVVLSWFRPEDYPRLRVALADGPNLPERYEDWLAIHDYIARADAEDGCPVEKVTLDLAAFSVWCRRHRCAMNAPARVLYAADRLTNPRFRHARHRAS